jgi:SUMO ligase MMS21 Smc5/6 complex component
MRRFGMNFEPIAIRADAEATKATDAEATKATDAEATKASKVLMKLATLSNR